MTKVEMLEQEIESLSPAERTAFRAWFVAFDADEWDRQIEADALSGRLDEWADAALAEHRTGTTRRL